VYWDYYNHEESFHTECIRKHKELGKTPIYAGGIWIWRGMGVNYGRTLATSESALKVCKREGVKEVFATL